MNHGLYDASEGSAPLPEQYHMVKPSEMRWIKRERFWLGMLCGSFVTIVVGSVGAAFAEPLNITGTIVDMQPAPHPAVAEVTMDNWSANGPQDDAVYPLAMPGLAIELEFTWNAGQIGEDRVTVIPPDGFICDPLDCQMTVPENSIGRVMIMPWIGG